MTNDEAERVPEVGSLAGQERGSLSTGLRRFLCEIAAGDLRQPLTETPLDWTVVIQELRRHALLGLAYYRFQNGPNREYPPLAFKQLVKEALAVASIQMKLKVHSALRVFRELADAGVDFLLIKGLAVGHTVYPKPGLRLFGDVDIVARERDWTIIHQVLLNNGFVSQEGWPSPPPKLFEQNVVQELQYWNADEQLLVEVHFEDILYAGLVTRDAEGFWLRARTLDLQGVSVRVMSAEDQLVHLCAHLHYDGVKRLNWFSDIAFIVRDHADELDWQMVLEIVRREEAQVPVYYALSYVGHALGVWPPEDVLAALRPDFFRRWWHERFVPEEKILSFELIPHPFFSFYFLPLFRRMIPDLLVMGRRGEKLLALLNLFAPPPAWLRHYYHLQATDDVIVHYLLHPLKLTYHYLIDVKMALRYLYKEKRGQRDWAWWCFDRP